MAGRGKCRRLLKEVSRRSCRPPFPASPTHWARPPALPHMTAGDVRAVLSLHSAVGVDEMPTCHELASPRAPRHDRDVAIVSVRALWLAPAPPWSPRRSRRHTGRDVGLYGPRPGACRLSSGRVATCPSVPSPPATPARRRKPPPVASARCARTGPLWRAIGPCTRLSVPSAYTWEAPNRHLECTLPDL